MTPRQQRFVEEYLISLNATEAAIRAGYKPKWAASNTDKITNNYEVAAAIKAGLEKKRDECAVTAQWVVKRLKEESELKGEDATHGGRVKALELLGKHIAMFTDKVEVKDTTPTEVEEEVLASRRKEKIENTPDGATS